MDNKKSQNTEATKIHFTLADVLATYVSESEESRELCEKLAGVHREYEYDFDNKEENYFDQEVEYLQKEYGISDAAALCLGIDLNFYAVKKTGDNLIGEMSKLCQGMGHFKEAVEDFLRKEMESSDDLDAAQEKVDKIIEEVSHQCNL